MKETDYCITPLGYWKFYSFVALKFVGLLFDLETRHFAVIINPRWSSGFLNVFVVIGHVVNLEK